MVHHYNPNHIYVQTDTSTPSLLGQQCWELLCQCWQWCTNGCNYSQLLHCCLQGNRV